MTQFQMVNVKLLGFPFLWSILKRGRALKS